MYAGFPSVTGGCRLKSPHLLNFEAEFHELRYSEDPAPYSLLVNRTLFTRIAIMSDPRDVTPAQFGTASLVSSSNRKTNIENRDCCKAVEGNMCVGRRRLHGWPAGGDCPKRSGRLYF